MVAPLKRKLMLWFDLLRIPQWAKNVFVAAPLLTGKKLFEPVEIRMMVVAVVVFSLCASFVYIINDILDQHKDAVHPVKSYRPIASKRISLKAAGIAAFFLLLCAAILSFVSKLPLSFVLVVLLYLTISITYSFGLKHVPVLELMVVASGYVLRVIAGCMAIAVVPSPWLLATTASVALLIVTGKRRGEMAEAFAAIASRPSLRLYTVSFLDQLMTILASITIAGYLLFTTSEYAVTRYHSPYLIGTTAFVAYGIFRYLLLVKTEKKHSSPTDLFLSDPGILTTVALWALTLTAIIYF